VVGMVQALNKAEEWVFLVNCLSTWSHT
jgi:hypothetical protein